MVCIAKVHSDLEGVGIHFGVPILRKAYSFGNYTFYFYDGFSFFFYFHFLNFAATIYSVEPQKRYKFSYTVHVYLPQPRSMVRVSSMQAQRTVLVIQGHLGKGTDSIPHTYVCRCINKINGLQAAERRLSPTQFHKDLLHKRKKLFGKCV